MFLVGSLVLFPISVSLLLSSVQFVFQELHIFGAEALFVHIIWFAFFNNVNCLICRYMLQPFRDMIEGMRMDLRKSRYNNFDELYLYCYYVAGTVGLMSVPIMGIAPESKATTESVYNAALALGIANQLTNILRDVGEEYVRSYILHT